jgi:hypothetical protein
MRCAPNSSLKPHILIRQPVKPGSIQTLPSLGMIDEALIEAVERDLRGGGSRSLQIRTTIRCHRTRFGSGNRA